MFKTLSRINKFGFEERIKKCHYLYTSVHINGIFMFMQHERTYHLESSLSAVQELYLHQGRPALKLIPGLIPVPQGP